MTGTGMVQRDTELNEPTLPDAARSTNEFLAQVSHDLRTPLNGIIGFSEFLLEGKPGPLTGKQREYLQNILDSGLQVLRLIDEKLTPQPANRA